MRTAAICPTCATYTNAVCVIYDGPYLSNLDIDPLMTIQEILGIIDSKVQLKLGYTPENVANKSINPSLGTSNTLYPSQKAVKTYVDNAISAIPAPPIPNLQQVLTSGNVATIGIQLNSPTPANNAFNGLRVFDNDVNFLYVRPSSIYWVGDEGDTTLQFSNTSGTYILTTPENNGTLALSVNGVSADVSGDITLPAPTLQQVTDVDNVTTNPIYVLDDALSPTVQASLQIDSFSSLPIVLLEDLVNNKVSSLSSEQLSFTNGAFVNTVNVKATNVTGSTKNIEIPNASGTFVLSVNGVTPNISGNVTLPAPSAWLLTGNSGTNPSTNFIGTTDAQDLVFKTNNVEYLRFNSVTGNNNEVSFLKNIKLTGTNSQIWVSEDTNGGYVTINADAADRGKITIAQNLSNRITIKSNNITGTSKTLQLPNATGTFALSVNGNAANTSGNVSVNLQSVLSAGNSLSNGRNFQGLSAGVGNTGVDVIGFGMDAGGGNTGSDVTAFGTGAAQGNQLSGVTVFSNLTLPTYADHTAASLAITVALGATSGNTYLYHNQATNSIGAVRL